MNTDNEKTRQSELIDKIIHEAKDEAEKLKTDAQASVAERRKTLQKRLAQIEASTDERIASEREKLTGRADAAISLLEGRARLRNEERIYRSAVDQTRSALEEIRSAEGYVDLVAHWIAEAAAGLGAEEAIVSCPEADRTYVEAAVAPAQKILQERGVSVELRTDPDKSEKGQGVVLRDVRGRRAFSNLVDDRLRRYGADLRRIVFHTVIED